jgi:hypothetical protein
VIKYTLAYNEGRGEELSMLQNHRCNLRVEYRFSDFSRFAVQCTCATHSASVIKYTLVYNKKQRGEESLMLQDHCYNLKVEN